MIDLILLLIGGAFFYWLIKRGKNKKTQTPEQQPAAPVSAEKPKRMSILIKILLASVVFSFIAATAMKENDPADPQVEADLKDMGLAYAACKMAFEKSAHDPKSIEWIRAERQGGFRKKNDGTLDKDKIINMQPVRAKNKFGALIRSNVICEAHRSGGTWNVASLHTSEE